MQALPTKLLLLLVVVMAKQLRLRFAVRVVERRGGISMPWERTRWCMVAARRLVVIKEV